MTLPAFRVEPCWAGVEWARFAEARNVCAGGADPPRSRTRIEFQPPITDRIRTRTPGPISLCVPSIALWYCGGLAASRSKSQKQGEEIR